MGLVGIVAVAGGCGTLGRAIDPDLVLGARMSIPRAGDLVSLQGVERRYREEEDEYEDLEEGETRSVVVAELLAIFPGLFYHGLGHAYAGDHQSARKLRSMGQWGYLLTAVGGGILVGAYFLDESSDDILPISMYVAGGAVGGVGLGYFFGAWGMDIYDTPRAIRTGGRPWRFLQEEGEIFE